MPRIEAQDINSSLVVLRQFHEVRGLEGAFEDEPDTTLWHLLFTLRRYCEAAGINFDATLANVREEEPSILGGVV